MEPYNGMQDVLLGYDTDLYFENGDLMTTTGVDFIEREIYKLLITEKGDWKLDPRIGCTPNVFSGDQNTRETGKKIQFYLTEGLRLTVSPGLVDVRVVPTNYDTMMIFIDIIFQRFPTDTMSFEFDFINGIKKFNKMDPRVTQPRSSVQYKTNNINSMKRPNKYWAEMRNNR